MSHRWKEKFSQAYKEQESFDKILRHYLSITVQPPPKKHCNFLDLPLFGIILNIMLFHINIPILKHTHLKKVCCFIWHKYMLLRMENYLTFIFLEQKY